MDRLLHERDDLLVDHWRPVGLPILLKSMTQFVSHALPPSRENACSHRQFAGTPPGWL
jgi:hypothetical protein